MRRFILNLGTIMLLATAFLQAGFNSAQQRNNTPLCLWARRGLAKPAKLGRRPGLRDLTIFRARIESAERREPGSIHHLGSIPSPCYRATLEGYREEQVQERSSK